MYFVGAGFGPKYGCVEGLLETVFSNLCDCWGNGHREYDECLDFDSHAYLLTFCSSRKSSFLLTTLVSFGRRQSCSEMHGWFVFRREALVF